MDLHLIEHGRVQSWQCAGHSVDQAGAVWLRISSPSTAELLSSESRRREERGAGPAALGLLAAQAPASAGAPGRMLYGDPADPLDAPPAGRASGFWDGGPTPATDYPGEAEQTCPRVTRSFRPVGRSTLSPWGRPAPRCVGSTADGMARRRLLLFGVALEVLDRAEKIRG